MSWFLTQQVLAGVGGTLPLLLDTYSGAAVAFSTRKLSSSYLGPCVRVRRSSDNAELNIGFSSTPDANGNYWIDETALLAFVGAGNGYVTTRYDQSGNGLHETQSTAASQSLIVSSGVIVRDVSRASLDFNGSSNFYSYAGSYASVSGISCFAISRIDTVASVANSLHHISVGTSSLARFTSGFNIAGAARFNTASRRLDADSATFANITGISTGFYQSSSIVNYSAGTSSSRLNNGTASTSSFTSGIVSNTAAQVCGSGGTSTSSGSFLGRISEEIVYSSAINNTSATAIANNQMTAFGVTP